MDIRSRITARAPADGKSCACASMAQRFGKEIGWDDDVIHQGGLFRTGRCGTKFTAGNSPPTLYRARRALHHNPSQPTCDVCTGRIGKQARINKSDWTYGICGVAPVGTSIGNFEERIRPSGKT